jgi:integrase
MTGMGVKVREKVKGSGEYWIFINHDNFRRSKKIGKKATADKVANQVRARLALGDLSLIEETKTFGDYADIWWVSIGSVSKKKTIKAYKVCLFRHILPVFGKRNIKKITKLDVKTFLQAKIADGQAQSSVNIMKSVLSGVFGCAIDAQEISLNPALQMGRIAKRGTSKPDMRPLDYKELDRLLTTFKKHFPDDYPIALLFARTGLRIGEVFALKWGDIDFVERTITVSRTRDQTDIDTPKNARERTVDMSIDLTQILTEYRKWMKERAMALGWGALPEWVCVCERGKPLSINRWRYKVFAKALEKAGLRAFRIHDLRHTFASMLLMAGENPAYVQQQLGHSSLRMTLDIYGHYIPKTSTRRGVDVLDGKEMEG